MIFSVHPSSIHLSQLSISSESVYLASRLARPDHVIAPPKPTSSPTINTTTMAPRKPRCEVKECNVAAQLIAGDCAFCNGHFCGKHRLLEDHKCQGLEDCKKEAHDMNAAQLQSERTQVVKGV